MPAMQVAVVPRKKASPHAAVAIEIERMFLEHLWISEDQRFFQHEGFDWKGDSRGSELTFVTNGQ